jgi:hypothetical protein
LAGNAENEVSVDGADSLTFETERLLASVKVAGQLNYGTTIVTPSLAATYLSDTQRAFEDAMGATAAEQSVETTDVVFGLDVAKPLSLSQGELILNGGISGIWSNSQGTGFANGVVPAFEGQRARIHFGASHTYDSGVVVSAGAFTDGLGTANYESYGLDMSVQMKF